MCCLTKRCFHYPLPFSSASSSSLPADRLFHTGSLAAASTTVLRQRCLPEHNRVSLPFVLPKIRCPRAPEQVAPALWLRSGWCCSKSRKGSWCVLSSCPCRIRLQSCQSSWVSCCLVYPVLWWFANILLLWGSNTAAPLYPYLLNPQPGLSHKALFKHWNIPLLCIMHQSWRKGKLYCSLPAAFHPGTVQ